jgi:hypothetical protein
MLLADLADFVARHRPCGRLTGDATEPASDGYLLSVGSEARVPAVSVEARHLLLAFITIPQAIP